VPLNLLEKGLLNVNVNKDFMHLPILVFVFNVLKNVQNVLMKHTVNHADLFLSEMSLHLYVLVRRDTMALTNKEDVENVISLVRLV
jgi:hypothetical protein